jgi:hypothetical protein
MGFNWIATADAGTYLAGSDITATFPSGNTAGDLIVVGVLQYTNTANVYPTTPTISDSAGNSYVAALGPEQISGGSFPPSYQSIMFFCKQCKSSSNNVITVAVDSVNTAANSVVMAMEYGGATTATQTDGAGVSAKNTAYPYTDGDCPSNPGDLIVSFGFDVSGLTGKTLARGSTLMTARYSNEFYCAQDCIAPAGTYVPSQFTCSSGTEQLVILAQAFKGWSALPFGGVPPGQPTRMLSTGPKYSEECLPKGRRMATMSIDCTVLLVTGTEFNYQELSDTSAPEAVTGYIAVEFDLGNFISGNGLEQVCSVIAYSRPNYGLTTGSNMQDDFQVEPGTAMPALLTALATNQSVPLGGMAVASGKPAAIETVVFPFPMCGQSMPVRVLIPQNSTQYPVGKFSLVFCNWPVQATDQIVAYFDPS